ncbi:MAG TPA: hypothetical protein VJX67_19465 [Blastocatellia bacterium]|nr:hypothetical protein [Blastocatellia bacterium]
MNKGGKLQLNPGDQVAYALPAGMHYGTVLRVLGTDESQAVEIEFEDGRKEIKKVRDRSLSLLRRATGASENDEKRSSSPRLKDWDVERIRRSEEHKH